jgi:hypothetical protein
MEEMMSEQDKLLRWMDENGFSISSLAQETQMSYDGMYQTLHVRKRISAGFRVRFIERFGADVAATIFDPVLTTQEAIA